MAVSRAFPSLTRSISTEIYLGHSRSCHNFEILRMERRGQDQGGCAPAPVPARPACLLRSSTAAAGGGEGWACSIRSAMTSGRTPPHRSGVRRPFPSWNRSILTEIYLCHACSCQRNIEDGNGRAGAGFIYPPFSPQVGGGPPDVGAYQHRDADPWEPGCTLPTCDSFRHGEAAIEW
eukprot:COSAG01_NODE_7377_length_3230_cov_7.645800_2_plen_177_part_00